MNTSVIIMGIIIVILIYILYSYLTTGASTLSKTASLTVQNPPITKLASPSSQSYAYGIWVYVNTWNTESNHTIFTRPNNIKLYMDTNKPTLYCDITLNSTTQPKQTITITNNFPMQTWVYVVVNVDSGTYVDSYINGKLINSTQLASVAKTPPSDTDGDHAMFIGNATGGNTFDASIAGFQNWPNVVGPQDVWNSYMSGNGGTSLSKIFGSYGVDISLTNNNSQTTSKFKIV